MKLSSPKDQDDHGKPMKKKPHGPCGWWKKKKKPKVFVMVYVKRRREPLPERST